MRIQLWNNQDLMERIRPGYFRGRDRDGVEFSCWFIRFPIDAYEVKAIQIENSINSARMLSFYDLSDVRSFPLHKWICLKVDVLPPKCMLELTSHRFGGSRISSYTKHQDFLQKNQLYMTASVRFQAVFTMNGWLNYRTSKDVCKSSRALYIMPISFTRQVSLKACGR